jgi:hypothetical protein
MATKTSLRKVAGAITGLTTAVANTFVEAAADIAGACHDAFGGSTDIPAAEIVAIQNMVAENAPWKGSSSEGARRSEVKSIVLAYPYLETASKVFKREHGELRREHFVKLARMCPEYVSPTDAALDTVSFFEKKGKGGASGTRVATIGMGLGIIKNTQTRKRNEIAFRKELAALCKKHGITY